MPNLIGTAPDQVPVNGFLGNMAFQNKEGVVTDLLSTTALTVTGTASFSGTIAASLGSAAAPSYTFTGDTNTGMFSPAADTIAFSEGGTEVMRIDSSANVGIGTSAPAAKVDVSATGGMLRVGGASGNNLIQSYTGGGSTAIGLWSGGLPRLYSTGDMYFSVGATVGTGAPSAYTDAMTITSAGNVGIGTVSPTFRLQVETDTNANAGAFIRNSNTGAAASGNLTVASAVGNIIMRAHSAANSVWPNSTLIQSDSGFTGGLNILQGGANPILFWTNGSERLRILATGGITSADLADAVGYKGVPQNSQTSSYTLALTDIGKHISITTGGVVVPANSSVAFPIGSTVVIYNNSASNQTISITTDTMYLAGTATTGSRTLAQRGLATCVKVAATTWVISGAGLT